MCARYVKYFHGYVLDVVMEYTSSNFWCVLWCQCRCCHFRYCRCCYCPK